MTTLRDMNKTKMAGICITIGILLTIMVFMLTSYSHVETSPSTNSAMGEWESVDLPRVPDQLDFCGEALPLERSDVYEAMERELVSNTFWHSNTILMIKRSARFFPVVEPILEQYDIPSDFKYLMVAESSLDPLSKSPVGAVGMWQFMESTGKEYGLEINSEVDERYNIEKSTRAACAYLKRSYNMLGSWTLVAASYNAGMARISKARVDQKQDDYYDLLLAQETLRYVYRIVAYKTILGNPDKYGFHIPESERYSPYQTVDFEIDGPVDNFAQFSIDHNTSYKILKVLNPWLRQPNLVNAKGKHYVIKLPANDHI